MISVFIGSATKSRDSAKLIASWLKAAKANPKPWYDGVFAATKYTLENLEQVAANVQGAVLLFGEDQPTDQDGQHVANGNVVFEAGFFVGKLGRNRVAICREGQPKRLSNLGGITYIDFSKSKRESARKELDNWVRSLDKPLPTDPPDRIEVHSSFPIDLFKDRLFKADQVRILQTFIPSACHMDLFHSELVDTLRSGGKVEILVCDHRSDVADIRAESLDANVNVKAQVKQTLMRLGKIWAGLPATNRSQFTVKVYSTLASVALYQVDDVVLSGSYFHRVLAVDGPLTSSATSSRHGKRLLREFDDIWNHPHTAEVPLDDVEGWVRE